MKIPTPSKLLSMTQTYIHSQQNQKDKIDYKLLKKTYDKKPKGLIMLTIHIANYLDWF